MSNLIKHLASRLCLRGTGIFCLCLMLSQPVSASISSITIDANTGKVLSANNADELRYPASLTKLMTLYITFDALEKGLIKLDDEFPVSRKAANRAPSRLGLRPGSKIKVKTAIEALIIRSANDCATVLAEGLGYSEENFAKTMTEVAHALGMENTTFKNASGLPNRQQKTTARDMAILGAAMYHHFPQYYKWFSLRKFTYEGKTYYTHNHVLKQFEGADGMKTGFTNAAGFNIITSADRNGQRVIAVTMGHRTQKDRDKKVISMMDKGLTRLALESSQSQSSTLHADLIEEHNQPVAIDTQLADNAQLSSSDNENEENAHPEIEQGSTDSDQIIKAEGGGNRKKMLRLCEISCKFSFLLMSMVSVPAVIYMPTILNIWLEEVPQYTSMFCIFILIANQVDLLTLTLNTANQAIGNVKTYNICVNTIKALTLVFIYFALKQDTHPAVAMIVYVIFEAICASARLIFLKINVQMSVSQYLNNVFFSIIPPLAINIAVCYFISPWFPDWGVLVVGCISIAITGLTTYLFGLKIDEREIINAMAVKIIKRIKR